jgi:mono/diheme cytochrome c family protein
VLGLIAIVLAFVLLGLTVVALAMRNGRKAGAKPSRKAQKTMLTGTVIVAMAFGLGIPALVLAYNADSQSKAGPGGVELSASQQDGREIFARNCATCHTLAAANSVGRVGPSLDAIIPPIADKKARIAFIDDAVKNGRARGQGQMPAGLIDGTDQQQVSDFIATVAGR